jgi:LPXTG-motif cell wall-anchored protein
MTMVGMRSRASRLIAAGGVMAAVLLPGAAMAQTGCPYGSGKCGPDTTVPQEDQDTESQGGGPTSTSQTSSSGTLPLTGGDAIGLALIGAGAVVGGTVLARSGRRKNVEV